MTAPTYDSTIKDARMTATRDAVADGAIQILDADDNVLAEWSLTTDGGTISGATWTLEVTDSDTTGTTDAGSGTEAASAQIVDDGGTARITDLSVGLQGSDSAFELDNLNIADGQTVTLSSASISHAPDPD